MFTKFVQAVEDADLSQNMDSKPQEHASPDWLKKASEDYRGRDIVTLSLCGLKAGGFVTTVTVRRDLSRTYNRKQLWTMIGRDNLSHLMPLPHKQ